MTNNHQQQLEQIDQEIIKLLSQRISLLANAELPSLEQQLSQQQLQLEQVGVPEFVWENVVIGTTAATKTLTQSSTSEPARRVTIIGGRGMMGQFFAKQLSALGHHVRAFGRQDWNQPESLLADADLVLICVPIEYTIEIIKKTAKYISPNTVLADITSIKAPFVQAMLEHHTGPVVGLHPMFGPGVKSFLSQTVVACPGRGMETFQWLLELIKNAGSRLIICSAEEHDNMMVAVQAIRHFSTFSLGVYLAKAGFDIGRSLEFSSPIYRLGIDLVSRLFAQDGSMYVDIMLATEERRQAIANLAKTIHQLAELVLQKDREALIQEFIQTRDVFGEESERAMRESSHVINALCTHIAADETQQAFS